MLETTQAFMKQLQEVDIHADVESPTEGMDIVEMGFQGENCPGIKVRCFFEDDPNFAKIYIGNIVKVPEDKIPLLLMIINHMNDSYKFFKFVLDTDDNTIQVESDMLIADAEKSAEHCFMLMMSALKILDDDYPKLMKGIYA